MPAPTCRQPLALAALLLAMWLSAVLGARQAPAPTMVAPALPPATHLQPGDWVFRSGTGSESRLIRRLSQSRYSHIGILVQTTPTVLVAHASTDDDPDKPNQVLLTPLSAFAAAEMADGIAIARPRFLTPAQRKASAAHAARRIGTPFVLAPRGQAHFYCTTLLLEAILPHAPDFAPRWQTVDIALFRGQYLMPQAFTEADIDWIHRPD